VKLAVILALITAPAFATELPPDLAKAIDDYDRAQVRNDTETLARLVDDDYILVNSDASVENKQQFLADFHLPGFKIDPYALQERIQKVWGETRRPLARHLRAGDARALSHTPIAISSRTRQAFMGSHSS
jgi:hypothetical protein